MLTTMKEAFQPAQEAHAQPFISVSALKKG